MFNWSKRPTSSYKARSDHYFLTWCLYVCKPVPSYKTKHISSENSDRYRSGRWDHWYVLYSLLSIFINPTRNILIHLNKHAQTFSIQYVIQWKKCCMWDFLAIDNIRQILLWQMGAITLRFHPWNWHNLEIDFPIFLNAKMEGQKKQQSFDPLDLPKVTAGSDLVFAHVVRPSVSIQILKSSKTKQNSLLARLWLWPSGSLFYFVSYCMCVSMQNLTHS